MVKYPKVVQPNQVVNENFAPGLFRIKGGYAFYDQVHMNDGGQAYYLVRITDQDNRLKVLKRWISHDTELEQMFKCEGDNY